MSVLKELAQVIGKEGMTALGMSEDGQSTSGSFEDKIRRTAENGEPMRVVVESNPFHDKGDGKFTAPTDIVRKDGGSKSFQFSSPNRPDRMRKGRIGKDKRGVTRALIQWVSSKQPCGRRARQAGKDIRCWDGNKGSGFKPYGESVALTFKLHEQSRADALRSLVK